MTHLNIWNLQFISLLLNMKFRTHGKSDDDMFLCIFILYYICHILLCAFVDMLIILYFSICCHSIQYFCYFVQYLIHNICIISYTHICIVIIISLSISLFHLSYYKFPFGGYFAFLFRWQNSVKQEFCIFDTDVFIII